MNKIKIVLIIPLLISFFSMPLFSSGIIFGAKSGYYTWDPYIKEIPGAGFENIENGTGILYGPVASVVITPDLTFSISALFGNQSTYWSAEFTPHSSDGDVEYITGNYSFETDRKDIDTVIGYNLFRYLKVFIGYKIQKNDGTISYTEIRTDKSKTIQEIDREEAEINVLSHGPAAGLGLGVPLGDTFFVAANLSYLYMKGDFNIKRSFNHGYDSTLTYAAGTNSKELKSDTKQYGLNFEPTIGFTSFQNKIIFTLGIRYQWLRTKFENYDSELGLDTTDDYFYGAYVSLLYRLSF